ncbi:hypothetical protein HRbin04_00519 [archaeon HR04]|nr:hypothetical protein HRbin04_00519 [archaeon HR04]
MERAERIAFRKAVKLHVFMPSNRRIWTVVGNRHEYWIHPQDYCTCKDYYFRARAVAIEGRRGREGVEASCYHLKAVEIAEVRGMVDEVHFNDDEYDDFIRALIDMMYKQVTKGDC